MNFPISIGSDFFIATGLIGKNKANNLINFKLMKELECWGYTTFSA